MTTPIQTQVAVGADAARWDVGDHRIWESTEPGVLLYVRTDLRFATDSSGRPSATVTRYLKWTDDAGFVPTGGAATFGFLGVRPEDAAAVLSLQDTWTRVIRASGYQGGDPRYLPLPLRDAALVAELDAAEASGTADGTTLRVELTAAGATAWAAAITDRQAVAGTIRLSHTYPRLMPPATAVVQLHGRKVYIGLSTMLTKAADGELSGTAAEIRTAWAELVRTGAIEVSLSGAPADELVAVRDDLVDQIRENLFDLMFVVRPDATALRWKRAADVPDLPLSVTVGGLTWLTETRSAGVTELLARLDSSVVRDVRSAVSVEAQVIVDPCDLVESVAVSLDFGELRPPVVLTFDKAGGQRTIVVTTEHPEQLTFEHQTRVVFSPSYLPVVSARGTTKPLDPAVVISPDRWLVRQDIHLFVVEGTWHETDTVSVTARCENFLSSSAITPDTPVTVTYPAVEGSPRRCTLTALGSVGGVLVQASRELPVAPGFVCLVVENGSLRIIDAADTFDQPRGKPLVRREVPPDAETRRDIAVTLPVALVPQPTTVSGWAAALAMVAGAREKTVITAAQVTSDAAMDLDTSYDWPRIREAAGTWRLATEEPRDLAPRDWAALLRQWGPIWVARSHRHVVVSGITGDGTPDGTQVRLNDPWPPSTGAVKHVTFTQFDREFGGARTALVHG